MGFVSCICIFIVLCIMSVTSFFKSFIRHLFACQQVIIVFLLTFTLIADVIYKKYFFHLSSPSFYQFSIVQLFVKWFSSSVWIRINCTKQLLT